MLNVSFWKLLLQFDRVLVFKSESMIYHTGIEKFYEYDYISAPFDTSTIPTTYNNGGLSLRYIKGMIYCLDNISSVKIPKYNKYLQEHIFYYNALKQFGFKMADDKTSSLFSIESCMHNDECLGSFKLYEYNNILYQKLIAKSVYNKKVTSDIYIIGGVDGGGSLKFITDFKSFYPNTKQITSKKIIQSTEFSPNDILLVQHLVHDITPTILTEIKQKYECMIIINIHDFYWFNSINYSANAYLLKNFSIKPDIITLFNKADVIVHPSKFTYNEYNKYISNDNFTIIPHIDYKILDSPLNIPLIKDNTINIGVMHQYCKYKGSDLIDYLRKKVENYNGYKIQFKIVEVNIRKYEEHNFYDKLIQYNIHCLTLLNIWGETYCYALSKFLKSGLPIIYNSIGAVSERIPSKSHYFKVFENEYDIDVNDPILEDKFLLMLDYIIENNSNLPRNEVDITLEIPPFYNNIINNQEKVINNMRNPYNVKAYCIYFPQFHTIQENNINYYKDYTDITNLNLLIKTLKIQQDTPSTKLLPLENILDYDLIKNTKLIQKQVDIMNNYNISGIAMYYYWFSKNTITKRNMIMEKVINSFFSPQVKMNNLKIFFIWANESWSKNLAFGNNKEIIENEYDEIYLIKNIDNLLLYFKHENYLKIDNKPVFFIHHPWFIPLSQLNLFKTLINKKCIDNKFDGCHLLINSMHGITEDYKHYDHHFNYKDHNNIKLIDNQISIDYESYVNNISKNTNVKTVAFNFDNRARLCKPDRLSHATITINNTENNQLKFLHKLYNSYNQSIEEIDKILLINSWNEWGEQMAIEPSNEKGTYYLDLLQNIL